MHFNPSRFERRRFVFRLLVMMMMMVMIYTPSLALSQAEIQTIATGSDARKFWVKQESDSLMQSKLAVVSRRGSASSSKAGYLAERVMHTYKYIHDTPILYTLISRLMPLDDDECEPCFFSFLGSAQGEAAQADQVDDSPADKATTTTITTVGDNVDSGTIDTGAVPKAKDGGGDHDRVHPSSSSSISEINNNNNNSSRWNANTRETVSLSLAKDQKILEERFARIRERELVIEAPDTEQHRTTQEDASGPAGANKNNDEQQQRQQQQSQTSWSHHQHALMAENVPEKVRDGGVIERPTYQYIAEHHLYGG